MLLCPVGCDRLPLAGARQAAIGSVVAGQSREKEQLGRVSHESKSWRRQNGKKRTSGLMGGGEGVQSFST